jgi:hypothetical protein
MGVSPYFEDSSFLGSYSTLERAKQMVKNYRIGKTHGYPIHIIQSTIDGDHKLVWVGAGNDYVSGMQGWLD